MERSLRISPLMAEFKSMKDAAFIMEFSTVRRAVLSTSRPCQGVRDSHGPGMHLR